VVVEDDISLRTPRIVFLLRPLRPITCSTGVSFQPVVGLSGQNCASPWSREAVLPQDIFTPFFWGRHDSWSRDQGTSYGLAAIDILVRAGSYPMRVAEHHMLTSVQGSNAFKH
jgi:hypothetical protein